MKVCRKCLAEKPVSEFNKQVCTSDGLQSYCRSCQALAKSAWKVRQASLSKSPASHETPIDRGVILTKKGERILVDEEDYDRLSQHTWYVDSRGYVIRNVPHPLRPNRKMRHRMHRDVMGLSPFDGLLVDHKFGNKLDNRKSELRVCTTSQNGKNRRANSNNKSGFKGVSWHPEHEMWAAKIRTEGKLIHLGYFSDPAIAHEAYKVAAMDLHGEFANFG